MKREIVGALIGKTITTIPSEISAAVQSGNVAEWIDRDRMKFMAACDLGQKWKDLAESRTLFCLDGDTVLPP